MNDKNPWGDMPAEEFRRYGYQIVDWIADYFERIEEFPVLAQTEPGWLRGNLPNAAPEHGEDFREVLSDVEKLILPAVTHWNHPNFHGLFSTAASSVGIFGEMNRAGRGQFCWTKSNSNRRFRSSACLRRL